MQYRMSYVWQQQDPDGSRSYFREYSNESVDLHLAAWADQGWELVTATTIAHAESRQIMHTFYWRKP